MEHKSEQLMQTALANGWKAQVIPDIPLDGNPDEIVWNLYCLRGQEAMHVEYTGNAQTAATYTFGDTKQYPARRVAIVKLLTGTPDVRRLNAGDRDIAELRTVPFLMDSPAVDIMMKVVKKNITWINSFTKQAQTAVVNVDLRDPVSAKNFKVYEARSGRRILEWVDPYGFHAVALEQIINVV